MLTTTKMNNNNNYKYIMLQSTIALNLSLTTINLLLCPPPIMRWHHGTLSRCFSNMTSLRTYGVMRWEAEASALLQNE